MFTACLDPGWISYFSGFAWFSHLLQVEANALFLAIISPFLQQLLQVTLVCFFNADDVYVTPVTQDHYYSINATQDYEILRTTSTVPMELGTIEYQTVPCSTIQYRAI